MKTNSKVGLKALKNSNSNAAVSRKSKLYAQLKNKNAVD